ncbi:MAG: amidase family protein, partial [Opitutaceae bacterium]|nr:amidase family protein [Opitutaceae bacterium]
LLHNGPWGAERYIAIQDLIENAPEILQPTTRAIIENGRQPSAVDAFEALYKMEALKLQANSAMSGIDFVATPTVGTRYTLSAFENDSENLSSNLGYYTNFINALDLSAIAIPTAMIENQIPFGLNLIAPSFKDAMLLDVADKLHQASELPLGASDLKRAN